jgi:hypothetical protein
MMNFEAIVKALAGPQADRRLLVAMSGAHYTALGLALVGPSLALHEVCTAPACRWAAAFADMQAASAKAARAVMDFPTRSA